MSWCVSIAIECFALRNRHWTACKERTLCPADQTSLRYATKVRKEVSWHSGARLGAGPARLVVTKVRCPSGTFRRISTQLRNDTILTLVLTSDSLASRVNQTDGHVRLHRGTQA